jgi:hypothetical protein
VAGINGEHGGSGTFLGPSVLTGRIAGATAAKDSDLSGKFSDSKAPSENAMTAIVGSGQGFWHFEQAHERVAELDWTCSRCHSERHPKRMTRTPKEMLARLNTCQDCH